MNHGRRGLGVCRGLVAGGRGWWWRIPLLEHRQSPTPIAKLTACGICKYQI